jgi:hypothetical protein
MPDDHDPRSFKLRGYASSAGIALLAPVERAAGAAVCSRVLLVAVHARAIVERSAKPAIPEIGNRGVPARDELELEKPERPE